jgi:hypothetical protein
MTDIQTPTGGEFGDDTQLPSLPGSQRPTDPRLLTTGVDDALPRLSGSEVQAPRWWAFIVDGLHVWGSIDVSPSRYGVTRYRLVVFPPGTDTVERRLLRVWRAWPTWGALLWLTTQIVLDAILGAGAALAVSTIAYLGSGAILFGRVNVLRTRVRTLSVVRIAGYTDSHAAAMFAELKRLVAALRHADEQRDRGQLSPAAHEAVVWRVYDRMGETHPGPPVDQASQ